MMQLSRVEQILQGEKIDVVQHHEEREAPEKREEGDAQRVFLQSRGPASGAGIEPIFSTFLATRRSDLHWKRTSDARHKSRSCSETREPLSIDVQSPLYTHLGVTTQPPTVTLIPHSRATRIRRALDVASKRSGSPFLVLALLLTGILVAGSFAILSEGPLVHNPPTTSSASASATGRVATLWPFSRDSIWNLPIGANAVYVPGNIKKPTAYGMTTDVDVLILTPTAPVTSVWKNNDAWSGGSRCTAEGGVLFAAPIPADFVVPGAGSGNPDGTTPNYATAILAADGHTLIQGQPMARCTSGGTATIWWYQEKEDLFGTGNSGAHGGSMLSSLGGVIRLGELVPGGTIRHALKVNLFGRDNYYTGSGSFRWPATTADGCAPGCYGGSVPALRMGSLLALPPSFDVNAMGLETEPAKILAHAFQDYGAYTVDDAAWSVYAVATEYSPSGKVDDEFGSAWGFPISPASRDVPWARDMDRIFGALAVVDNWDSSTWQTVSASNGTLGAGLGAPRVAWAPDFGPGSPDTVPPVASASLSGTTGAANWFVSRVNVTLSATDDSSGVAAIHFRTDGGAWQLYAKPVAVSAEGSHSIEYYATDLAGNNESSHTATFHIDTVAPVTLAQVAGTLAGDGSYVSSVTVTLTASDATSGVQSEQYRVDGGPWRTYSVPFTLGGNGTHMLDYFATDVAGSAESVRGLSIRITGDSHVLPVSTLSSSGVTGANGWYVSPVTVTLTATSGSGVATSIAYRIDGDVWVTYSQPFTLPDGRHVLVYQATDADGYSEVSKSSSFTVDSAPPSVLANSPSAPIGPDDSLSWSGSDAGSGIARYEVSIDGAAFVSIGLQTTLARHWTAGTHVVVVRAYDAAGNSKSSVIQFSVAENPTPTTPSGPSPRTPPGIPKIVVGLLMLGISMWFRPRVKTRRPVPPP